MDYTDALKFLTSGTNLKWRDLVPSAPTQMTVQPHLGKRKREEVAAYIQPSDPEIRSALKRCKVKITDLGALQKARAGEGKVQKDHFRLYPSPVTSFEHLRDRFNVRPSLARNLVDQDYVEPTEVQMAVLPLLLDVEAPPHLLTVAPTGSGKTLAFMLPLIHNIMQSRHKIGSNGRETHVTALILAPTKELVGQIVNEGRKLSAKTGVSISAVRKGMVVAGSTQLAQSDSEDSELDEESQNAHTSPPGVKSDILVSTPLALLRAISNREDDCSTKLPHVRHLILDEADILLDPLFRDQTLPVWKACIDPELQVSLWSATMGSNIEEMAMVAIDEHEITSSQSKRQLLRCVIGLKDSAVSTITHRLICAGNEYGKLLGFRDILHPPPGLKDKKPRPSLPFLVYTQTIERANALYSELEYDIPASAGGLERVAVIHSKLSEKQRTEVMKKFRSGKIWVMITTDLLSRGIDFHGINGVVNYDIPNTTADYVHRAGRAGRAGREGGIVVTLWTQEDIKYLRGIANVIAASEKAKGGSWESAEGVRKWMFDGLPKISKKEKKELKTRGVKSRRGVREGDDEKVVRVKRKSRIGTKSGYQIQKDNNRNGAIEASKRRSREEEVDNDTSEWNGF